MTLTQVLLLLILLLILFNLMLITWMITSYMNNILKPLLTLLKKVADSTQIIKIK